MLPLEEVFQEVTVIRLNDLSIDTMLSSQMPAEVIYAILSNYQPERKEAVLRTILYRLQAVCQSQS